MQQVLPVYLFLFFCPSFCSSPPPPPLSLYLSRWWLILCLSVSVSLYLSLSPSLGLCLPPSLPISVRLLVCLSVCLFVCPPSVRLFVYLCLDLSVCVESGRNGSWPGSLLRTEKTETCFRQTKEVLQLGKNLARFAYYVWEGIWRKEQTLAVLVDVEDAYNRVQFKLLMELLAP